MPLETQVGSEKSLATTRYGSTAATVGGSKIKSSVKKANELEEAHSKENDSVRANIATSLEAVAKKKVLKGGFATIDYTDCDEQQPIMKDLLFEASDPSSFASTH